MPYAVCTASDVPPGNLAVIGPGGRSRLAIAVAMPGRRFMLMLPGVEREPARDFGLLRVDTMSGVKALDLGSGYSFDFDPLAVVLPEAAMRGETGSLLIANSRLLLMGMLGGDIAWIDVNKGERNEDFRHSESVEISSWRLLLKSHIAEEPPREVVRWP